MDKNTIDEAEYTVLLTVREMTLIAISLNYVGSIAIGREPIAEANAVIARNIEDIVAMNERMVALAKSIVT